MSLTGQRSLLPLLVGGGWECTCTFSGQPFAPGQGWLPQITRRHLRVGIESGTIGSWVQMEVGISSSSSVARAQ